MAVRSLRLSLVAAVASVALFSAACGTDKPEGTAAKNIKELPANLLSSTYDGLVPKQEDIKDNLSTQEANAYIESVSLFSLRKGDRLEATLQISKLSDKARPEDEGFQNQIASQIGGSKVERFFMGGIPVFRSSLRKQALTSWFHGDYFMVLAVRDTYPTPRTLLRNLVEEVTP